MVKVLVYLNRLVFVMSVLMLTARLLTSSRKLFFCMMLYSEEVNLESFVLFLWKSVCDNYLCTKCFILFIGFPKVEYFFIFPITKKPTD